MSSGERSEALRLTSLPLSGSSLRRSSCSCSDVGLVTMLRGALSLAALGAKQVRTAEMLDRRGAGRDLPVRARRIDVIPFDRRSSPCSPSSGALGFGYLFWSGPRRRSSDTSSLRFMIGDSRAEPWHEPGHRGSTVSGGHRRSPGPVADQSRPVRGRIGQPVGFGAVLLLAWRTFRQPSSDQPVRPRPPATKPMSMWFASPDFRRPALARSAPAVSLFAPRDDRPDDLRPLRLVMELVTEIRERAALDVSARSPRLFGG